MQSNERKCSLLRFLQLTSVSQKAVTETVQLTPIWIYIDK